MPEAERDRQSRAPAAFDSHWAVWDTSIMQLESSSGKGLQRGEVNVITQMHAHWRLKAGRQQHGGEKQVPSENGRFPQKTGGSLRKGMLPLFHRIWFIHFITEKSGKILFQTKLSLKNDCPHIPRCTSLHCLRGRNTPFPFLCSTCRYFSHTLQFCGSTQHQVSRSMNHG